MTNVENEIMAQEEMCEQLVRDIEVGCEDLENFPKPTEEEIEEYTKELEEAIERYNNMEDYVVCDDPNKAKDLLKLALKYNNEMYQWKKDEWKGVLMFDKTMSTQDASTVFTIDKNNLQWLFYIITNPSGIGIESARVMESNGDLFVDLIERICEIMDEFKEVVENLRFLQDKLAAAHQGFYMRQDGVVMPNEEASV